jgi:hypothetical protein
MRKQSHPYKIKTKVQLKDGSIYWKRWLYFRPVLALDMDITTNLRWKHLFNNLLQKRFSVKEL